MVSAVSGASSFVATSSNAASPTAAADKTLNLLLQSPDVQQFLVSRSSIYLPLSSNLVLSVLWAGINVNSSHTINESDLYKFVVSAGGKSSDAHALWLQIAPPDANGHSTSSIDAAGFAFSSYLSQAISSNLASLQASARQTQQQQGPDMSGSFLGTFSVLSGSNSFIGNGEDNAYFFNFFA